MWDFKNKNRDWKMEKGLMTTSMDRGTIECTVVRKLRSKEMAAANLKKGARISFIAGYQVYSSISGRPGWSGVSERTLNMVLTKSSATTLAVAGSALFTLIII